AHLVGIDVAVAAVADDADEIATQAIADAVEHAGRAVGNLEALVQLLLRDAAAVRRAHLVGGAPRAVAAHDDAVAAARRQRKRGADERGHHHVGRAGPTSAHQYAPPVIETVPRVCAPTCGGDAWSANGGVGDASSSFQ